ncbi:acyloxyacyl hydrolase [Alteromonas sp. KUL106]|uniref:acyloxyacyl hydrolase n=1 Tax=Alteromonas sp. KUL106 TaxID=2480799 RepID=UPI0012E680B9|nr:acyloxyacyl hydrolase [Alteromonas sp. KUL106]GFD69031.1 lipid A deacylase [Alteromonas sp. KUL106]
MKQTSFLSLSFLIAFTVTFTAQARQTVSVDYMHGFDGIDGMRLAYRPLEQTLVTDWFGDIKLYWEISAVVWEYGKNDSHSTSYAASITPVFMKQITTLNNKYPIYLEAGIGASYIGDQEVAGKDIGSNYQFEDRIGFFMELDKKQHVALRYMHFSNGGFNNNNPGLDFLNVSYAYHF